MNNRLKIFVICSLLLSASLSGYSQTKSSSKISIGVQSGFNRGFGISGNFTIHNIAEDLSGNIRFGAGYNRLNPGKAADVRRIFINNGTNGVPEKKGESLDLRIDYLMPYSFFDLKNSYLVFGPRYSSFTGEFNYIGGNEKFTIKSKQLGIGIGAENYFKMSSNLDLVLATGLDYFFNSKLDGHDTSYSPNNDNVNPRDDNQNNDVPFTFKDANKAVKQPQFMPRIMIGVAYHL